MKASILCITISILLLLLQSCKQVINEPEEITISGKLINLSDETMADSTITLIVGYPFLENRVGYQTRLKSDGSFSQTLPFICPTNIITTTPWGTVQLLSVYPENKIEMEITKKVNKTVDINMIKGKFLTKQEEKELQNVNEAIQEADNYEPIEPDMEPNAYRNYKVRRMKKDLAFINKSNLSDDIKQQMLNLMHSAYLAIGNFDYKEGMELAYLNKYSQDDNPVPFSPQKKPDLSYYTFLREFDLNNPSTFNTEFYSRALQVLLKDSVLALPDIGDSPIQEWINNVKLTFTDLVGFSQGYFYDYLAANAYVKQLNGKLEPLSEIQKENIIKYFKNPSYKTLLFEESNKIKGVKSIISHPTPAVSKEELMKTIISQYEGKIVFVDFWATWCGPCLNAISESKSLKESLTGKDITFLYIAGYSSAEAIWRRTVSEIEGGVHYYLNEDSWQYLLDNLGAKGIPFYVIYDKKGNLMYKSTGYPGNNEVKKILEGLL